MTVTKPGIHISVGCDIVKVARIKKMMQDQSVLNKVFHPSELSRFDAEHLAGIFAAKESAFKALGLKAGSWLDIELINEHSGKPTMVLADAIRDTAIMSMDCSISHDGEYAFASVVSLTKS